MKQMLTARWSEIKKWWSVWIGAATTLLLAGVPALADQWPNVAPSITVWFPKNGAQVAPIIGTALTVAARIISQRAVLDQLRKLFGKPPKGEDHE
jgi:hypothetical protein